MNKLDVAFATRFTTGRATFGSHPFFVVVIFGAA
jgi:hypothetical protein